MAFSTLDGVSAWPIQRSTRVHPYPVAVGSGRVLRASSPETLIEACLKAGEILTRYVVACAVGSWSHRESSAPELSIELHGDLAWGTFLACAQRIAGASGHPLTSYLSSMRPPKKGGPGKAEGALSRLLALRNKLGHTLSTLGRARAESVLVSYKPLEHYLTALEALEGLLGLPIFVVEECRFRRPEHHLEHLVLMGDSADPIRETFKMSRPFGDELVVYLGIDHRTITLPPLISWQLVEASKNRELVILDKVKERAFVLVSVNGDSKEIAHGGESLDSTRPIEEAHPLEGSLTLAQVWRARSRRLEDALRTEIGGIPWDDLDETAMKWFAWQLDRSAPPEQARATIQRMLLSGRTFLEDREAFELRVLLGKQETIKALLRRLTLDIRSTGRTEARFDDRDEVEANLVIALRHAVNFVYAHLGIDTPSGLEMTAGSPEYIIIREALVNLLIHQDYREPSAAGQITLMPDGMRVFNPGHSLVPPERLSDGYRSQSRNPLIARAFRLIRYAELGGTGLTSLQQACRKARRRPPRFHSSESKNTFALDLSWKQLPEVADPNWLDRLGVALSTDAARVLEILLQAGALSAQEVASGTGLLVEETDQSLRLLLVQALASESGGTWRASESALRVWASA